MIEIAKHVVRICRLRKLRCMARIAVRVLQLIIAVHMALLALCCCMTTREWEVRCRVIERCRLPGILCVALQAIVIELPLLMIRIRCVVKMGRMTIPARVG